MQQIQVEIECRNKPKLKITLKDFQNLPPHVYKPLSFIERKIISKTHLGIFPICLETARYLRPVLPKEQ
jgi:hypothetical protein